jgi:hypothetical protein
MFLHGYFNEHGEQVVGALNSFGALQTLATYEKLGVSGYEHFGNESAKFTCVAKKSQTSGVHHFTSA